MRRDYYPVLGIPSTAGGGRARRRARPRGGPRFLPGAGLRATGQADGARCGACHGRGVRRVIEPVTVAVPAGVDAGVQIRVPGEGSAGPFGGPRGDLLVSTRVAEHPFFARKGDSVHCEVPITVWEALQGARIRVPTPAGEAARAPA